MFWSGFVIERRFLLRRNDKSGSNDQSLTNNKSYLYQRIVKNIICDSRLGYFFPPFLWRHVIFLFEHPCKITGVFIAAIDSNSRNTVGSIL